MRGGLLLLLLAVGVAVGPAVGVAVPVPASAAAPDDLARVKERLAALAEERGAPPAVSAWWVDAASRTVVLALNAAPRDARAADYVDRARAVDPAVRVRDGVPPPPPRPAPPVYDLVGGDAIRLNGTRCSIGFSATTVS